MSSQHGAKRIRANPAPAGGGALAAAVLRDVLLDMVVSRTCRIRRKVFMVSVACFGFVCLLTYSFASSCCSLVVAIQPGSVPWSGPLVSRPASPTAGRGDESPSGRAVHSRDRQENPNGFHFRHRNINDVKRMSGGQGTGDDQTYDDDDDEQDNVYVDESADNYDDGGGWGESRFQSSQKTRTTIGEDLKNATKKLPRAIIIGVKKGGTRAVLAFLQVHPNVRAPGPEPHFFDRHYHRGLDWYRNKMPPTLAGHITIEKTPSYFVTKEVPRRIFNMSKDVKLIVVVRDPVTRAISDYTQTASKRPGVKQFEHMVFMNNTTRIVDTSWAAIRIGVYAKHLDQWFQFFPLKQMHFVSGERLISDPAGEMAKLQDFLGLKRVITDNHFVFDETKGFPCLRKPEGTGRSHCLGKTKGRQHPQIHPHVLKRLRDFYRPFNAKFYQMVRQDFGWS